MEIIDEIVLKDRLLSNRKLVKFYRPIRVCFTLLNTEHYGKRIFAIEKETGVNLTHYWSCVGYDELASAIEDTEKIITSYGGCHKDGHIYTKIGFGSYIEPKKSFNFTELKILKILK